MRYGLLTYSTTNIGDEIQSVAARRFLPAVDVYIDRDSLNRTDESEPFKIILNGWFTHRPDNWPPAPQIRPLFVSFHITREIHRANIKSLLPSAYLVRGQALDYLRSHQPIGCRDPATTELLQNHDVEAYFSGCLTLTLENRWPQRGNCTYCVDVPELIARYVADKAEGPMIQITHRVLPGELQTIEARSGRAEELLEKYATAKLVVTSRLHCALPCLALGTPVVFIAESPDNYRLRGLCELTRHYTAEEVLTGGADDVDWRDPKPNPVPIDRFRRDLAERCSSFVRSVPNAQSDGESY
jgi:hypothetical protein